jgi:hypothetical protein
VLRCFLEASEEGGLTKAIVAKRLRKGPEQITRWLGAPGNWTLNTVSDLLLAMNCEVDIAIVQLQNRPAANEAHDWVMQDAKILSGAEATVSISSVRSNTTWRTSAPSSALRHDVQIKTETSIPINA